MAYLITYFKVLLRYMIVRIEILLRTGASSQDLLPRNGLHGDMVVVLTSPKNHRFD